MTAIAPPPVGFEAEPKVQRDNARALSSLETTVSRPIRTRGASALALVAFGAATLAAGAVSGLVNRKTRNKLWYRTLIKPSFTPPDRVFSLVWPVLYAGAAYSGWRVWKAPASPDRSAALALWGAQLALNGSWSPLFFGAHRPKLALADLAGNFATLGAYTYTSAKVDRPAAAVVLPYLGWLGFAGFMNAGIITKNRWRFA